MTTTVKTALLVPASLQRKAGIKSGDRVVFTVSPRTITITAAQPPKHKPTKAELAAIRKGEKAIERGEFITLDEFVNDLDRSRRKPGAKTVPKVSR